VVLNGLPRTLSDLIQQTGRAGRRGEASEAWIFATKTEALKASSPIKTFLDAGCLRKNLLG
jgi:superfamily II DNA helicase RecQ